MGDNKMIAPCGLDCSKCDIYIAAHDPEFAEQLAAQWRTSWMPKAQPDWFKCQGCRADRALCWSGDCKIYKCCMEEKSLESCSRCAEFACEQLEKWAAEYPNHGQALDNLKKMRDDIT